MSIQNETITNSKKFSTQIQNNCSKNTTSKKFSCIINRYFIKVAYYDMHIVDKYLFILSNFYLISCLESRNLEKFALPEYSSNVNIHFLF